MCANNPVNAIDPNGMEIYYLPDGTCLGQLGDNEDIRVINSMKGKDARSHFESGSEESIAALMDGSVAFADYFTPVNDVTNNAALVRYGEVLDANGRPNCKLSADKQMSNAGYKDKGSDVAIQTKVSTDSNLSSDAIGGAISLQTDLMNGKPVIIGVEQSLGSAVVAPVGNTNELTTHFVVVRSVTVQNGIVSFNYLDNGTRLGKSPSNNLTLNISTGAITGYMSARNVNYHVSEVRRSSRIR